MEMLIEEVEAVINFRPLTQVNKETDEVIRPIDFIILSAEIGSSVRNEGYLSEDDDYVSTSRQYNESY